VVALSREEVDAVAVAAAGARLRDCSAHVPRPATGVPRAPASTALSVWTTVERFDAVWGDGLAAVRAELGLLASALQQASWARQDLERASARLMSHAGGVALGGLQ
jgi:hypothetical protein